MGRALDHDGSRRTDSLLHELQVHQAELEIQNAQLRESQAQLEAARQRYLALFENIPSPCLSLSPGGTVVECNRAAENIFAQPRVRLRGRPLLLLVDFADHARLLRHLDLVRELDQVRAQEFLFRRGDGGVFQGLLDCRRVAHGTSEPVLLCSLTDVTETRRHEAALRSANDEISQAHRAAEQALVAKSRFLAAASHDLRQPVQALNLFIDLLDTQVEGSPAAQTSVHIRKSVEALSQLLHGILDLSRLEAGLVVPRDEDVETATLMERLGNEFSALAAAKGLEFRVKPVAMTLRTDPLLLERMLRNVLANSLRYTKSGGVLLGARRRAEWLGFEVWDTGIGIPDDQIALIFEDFHQVGNPSRDRAEGLGLGLAIVERLARLLGYRLDLRSSLGKGTRFVIEVPLGK